MLPSSIRGAMLCGLLLLALTATVTLAEDDDGDDDDDNGGIPKGNDSNSTSWLRGCVASLDPGMHAHVRPIPKGISLDLSYCM